jgi:hypothetical protein
LGAFFAANAAKNRAIRSNLFYRFAVKKDFHFYPLCEWQLRTSAQIIGKNSPQSRRSKKSKKTISRSKTYSTFSTIGFLTIDRLKNFAVKILNDFMRVRSAAAA